MSEAVEIWAEALQDLVRVCLPHELRQQVLVELTAREEAHVPYRIIGIDELMTMKFAFRFCLVLWVFQPAGPVVRDRRRLEAVFADYRGKREVFALLIQIATRSVVNNHSPETAAALLFRDQHGYGTGSGWLPDYLDGLPGITVDLKACVAISDRAPRSRLREIMRAEAAAEELP